MRCKYCAKILGNKHTGYRNHLRVHKLSDKDKHDAINEAFPGLGRKVRRQILYNGIKIRMSKGEQVSKKEFAIAKEFDQRKNGFLAGTHKDSIYKFCSNRHGIPAR